MAYPAATNTGRFQYTGQIWLPELGMYHYKARVYSPTLGRFLQTDPIGYADQFNLYTYVGNDPINLIDPIGQYRLKGGSRPEAERLVSAINPISRTQYRVDFFSQIGPDLSAQPNPSGSPTFSEVLDELIRDPSDYVVDYGTTVTENGATYNIDVNAGGGVTYPKDLIESRTNIILSGNGSIGVRAEGGGVLNQSPAMVAMHELVSHAASSRDPRSDSGLARENQILEELNQPRRAPDPRHPF